MVVVVEVVVVEVVIVMINIVMTSDGDYCGVSDDCCCDDSGSDGDDDYCIKGSVGRVYSRVLIGVLIG